MINIRFPNITDPTDAGKLRQMQSFMHQLVEQLNWALSNLESTSTTPTAKASSEASTASQDDPISNFNSIKGLIIKSADIVTAYYEEIDNLLKLSGEYTASSDFGTFVEKTTNELSTNSSQIQQNIDNLQAIFDEDGNIKTELLVNGHIYSGIIEYAKDGEAIVGIEIGQTTKADGTDKFNRFARFTAEKLAFYTASDADNPVAYISGYNLYITNAQITGSFRVGGYKDIVDPLTGGIVTKWVGGV